METDSSIFRRHCRRYLPKLFIGAGVLISISSTPLGGEGRGGGVLDLNGAEHGFSLPTLAGGLGGFYVEMDLSP